MTHNKKFSYCEIESKSTIIEIAQFQKCSYGEIQTAK